MNSSQDTSRTVRGKKAAGAQPPPLANPGHSGPTTFFLRSEKDMEKSAQRGRRASHESASTQEEASQKTPMGSLMDDSSFGVESLEDTLSSAFSSDNSLSRTNSNMTDRSAEACAEGATPAGRKRKARNPVHPRIAAAGQRIISSEYIASGAATADSPASFRSSESPFRSHLRRGSAASSINMSQPITPLKMSPQPDSAMPSTPRSGSPKSFRLSDEELLSETSSQAVQSSSGEEQEDDTSAGASRAETLPQLVMPSISMPTRRPFTERGRRMGRLKVMVVGPQGIGKTSLIQSICRVCEDVVHMDSITGTALNNLPTISLNSDIAPTKQIVEVGASTRSYPSWWTDFESRRMLLRRKSMGDGVLERNLTFIDTPGFHAGCHVDQVLEHFKSTLQRTGQIQKMHDSELIHMLSGEGGAQVDGVLYLFDPAVSSKDSPEHMQMDYDNAELLQYLCKWTNVIPLIGRADTVEPSELVARKEQLMNMFKSLQVQPCFNQTIDGSDTDTAERPDEPDEPFTISSALGNDLELIDASVLMSSSYLQPLVPSELSFFINHFLEPENIARLRHLSAAKFLLWRQENLGSHLDLQKQLLLQSPRFDHCSREMESTRSMPDDESKVLVPYGSSSYFRSPSPAASDNSAISGSDVGSSTYALARYNNNASPTEPFRQVRLAKWAQDLQRGLDSERRRYKQMYANVPSDWTSNQADSDKAATDANRSLVANKPATGRLGGDLGIIDPRDPLGVLVFSQALRSRGWFALQVAGGCGLIGAVAWWTWRDSGWVDVQEWFSFGQPSMMNVTAVPAPTRGWLEDIGDWRGFFGWGDA